MTFSSLKLLGNENAFSRAFPKIIETNFFTLTYRDKMFFLETVRLVLILLDFTSDFCHFSPVDTDRHRKNNRHNFYETGFPSRPYRDELIIR